MYIRLTSLALSLAMLGSAAHAEGPLQGLNANDIEQDDPAIVELGKMLFFDPRLSGDASTACSDCHDPNYGWSDGSELARGYPGTMHWRNSQTIVNVGFMDSGFHWDSGLGSLSDQVHDAMGAGFVANIDTILGEERLRQIPEYDRKFNAIWNEGPTQAKIAEAIAAYERTIVSDDSPFDRYMAGQTNAMSASALRGKELFEGKANCSACHSGALASDQQFHNTSVPPNLGLSEDPLRQVTFRYLMRVKGLEPEVYAGLDRDPGRYLATKNPDDLGLFRTPPLRYLSYTAPYMHNGIFYTLEEVVQFYNVGGTQDAFGTKSALIKPLGLNRPEKDDLVAFLESMSGSEVRTDIPALPDYEIQAFPSVRAVITAASLKERASLPVTQAAVEARPAATGALQLKPVAKSNSTGLTLTPKNASKQDVSAPAPQVYPDLQAAKKVVSLGGQLFISVEVGDTLGTLSSLLYGTSQEYAKLFDANRDQMRSADDIAVGMLLRIPR